ncbi:MAG TPA: SpoIID/LytB domain-containing protein [Gaiellaceae bacterium]|jgi:stage II sporulation protein D
MTHRAQLALVICTAGLILALVPLSAVAGSQRARESSSTLAWSPATLVFSGHGWGHGVGLSQYGAYGYALHGYTYDQMIAHYYPGTDLETEASKTIRVLLAGRASSLAISSDAPFSITDSSGASYELPDLSLKLTPSLKVDLGVGNGPTALSGPLLLKAGTSPLAYAGRKYRGAFRIFVVGDKLRLVNSVGLEPYLYGVVPAESPHDWPAEALKAQAVVARSYALSSLQSISDFDVYADTRSQVYLGISGEWPESTAAVKDTVGEVVYYNGEVARTFFFSTSGGRTSAIKDAWPKAKPLPYLISVNDPYDGASPYHSWGPVTFSAKRLAKSLHVSGPISDLTTKRNGSKRVAEATVTGSGENTWQVTGDSVKLALGLRSSWFTATVLALQYPRQAVAAGSKLRIEGRARNAQSPALEMRTADGAWQKVRNVSPDSSGLFKVTLKPDTTSVYRLVATDAVGEPVEIKVAAAS